MLYPLKGSRSTAVDLLPFKGYIHTICLAFFEYQNFVKYHISTVRCHSLLNINIANKLNKKNRGTNLASSVTFAKETYFDQIW